MITHLTDQQKNKKLADQQRRINQLRATLDQMIIELGPDVMTLSYSLRKRLHELGLKQAPVDADR